MTETPDTQALNVALDRVENAVTKHPSLGIGTGRSVSTITGGLRCTSEEGGFQFETDLPDTMGAAARVLRRGCSGVLHSGAALRCPIKCGRRDWVSI